MSTQNMPRTSYATIQPNRQNVFTDAKVAILFKEITNSSLDLITDLLHERKFKSGVVNMIKTMYGSYRTKNRTY